MCPLIMKSEHTESLIRVEPSGASQILADSLPKSYRSAMGLLGVFVTVVGVIAATIFVFMKSCKDTLLYGKIRNVFELLRMLMVLKSHAGSKNGKVWSYVDEFERKVDTEADVTQFIFVESEEHLTRSALDRRANQMAHWARSPEVDLRQHDTVAFMMQNCPDFVAFWLGVSKVIPF